MIGIYKITSPTGKVYIGQSWNINKRFYKYKGSMCDKQPKLHASFTKHGTRSHLYDVICELPSDVMQQVLDDYERAYIGFYKDAEVNLLNIKDGGKGGRHSNETKSKISAAQKGIRKANAGSFKAGRKYIPSEKQKKSISEALKGKPLKEETKRKLSDINLKKGLEKRGGLTPAEYRRKLYAQSRLGVEKYVITPEHRAKMNVGLANINVWNKGVPMTEDVKQKIIDKKSGVKQSEQHRIARSIAVKEWWRKRKEALC